MHKIEVKMQKHALDSDRGSKVKVKNVKVTYFSLYTLTFAF